MNYEAMSDLQINLLVANAIGVDAADNDGVVFGAVKHEGANVVSVMGVVDYCNNPSDAWQIIIGNCIVITPCVGGSDGCVEIYHAHKNSISIDFDGNERSLRTAMIAFLMMKDAECQKP